MCTLVVLGILINKVVTDDMCVLYDLVLIYYKGVYGVVVTFSKHRDVTMDSHYLYLSNTAGQSVFTSNTSSAFENLIHPLSLDKDVTWEVGVANFLHPSEVYLVEADNAEYGIQVVIECQNASETHDFESMTYIPSFSVLGSPKSIDILLRRLNRDFYNRFKATYGETVADRYMPEQNLLAIDETSSRCRVVHTYAPEGNNALAYICDLCVIFAPRLARTLGFDETRRYPFFMSNQPPDAREAKRDRRDNLARAVARLDGGVDYVYIYSDIVAPSRFGHKLVNILDAFAIRGSTSHKGSQPILYKPLLHRELSSVAIKVLDQDGRDVAFEKDHALTVILHIRPK